MKILKGKVLPWLRKKLQDKGFRVSQLMDYHLKKYPLITMEMVEECHKDCGNTLRRAANTKWALLYTWQVLCSALQST